MQSKPTIAGFALLEILIALTLLTYGLLTFYQAQWKLQRLWLKQRLYVMHIYAASDRYELQRARDGFTLVEVLITLVLASMIFASLLPNYFKLKQQHSNFSQNINQELELHGLVAWLKDSIHHAGFTPCKNLKQLNSAIKPLEMSAQSVITRRMADNFVTAELVAINKIHLNQPLKFNHHQPILIANCQHLEVNHISRQIKQVVILQHPVIHPYQEIYLGSLVEEEFYWQNAHLMYKNAGHSEQLSAEMINFSVEKIQTHGKIGAAITLASEHYAVKFISYMRS